MMGDKCMKQAIKDTVDDDSCGCMRCRSHGVDPDTGDWYSYINGRKTILEPAFGSMLDSEREEELDRMRNGKPLSEKQIETKKMKLERDLDYYKDRLENIPKTVQRLKDKIKEVEQELKEI